MSAEEQRKFAAIMFTDMVGYSAMSQRDEKLAKDCWRNIAGSRVLQYFAITAAWAGERELALQQLEAGLRAPAASQMLSYGALKLFPAWDPLRGDPRFEKIVASLAPKDN